MILTLTDDKGSKKAAAEFRDSSTDLMVEEILEKNQLTGTEKNSDNDTADEPAFDIDTHDKEKNDHPTDDDPLQFNNDNHDEAMPLKNHNSPGTSGVQVVSKL